MKKYRNSKLNIKKLRKEMVHDKIFALKKETATN